MANSNAWFWFLVVTVVSTVIVLDLAIVSFSVFIVNQRNIINLCIDALVWITGYGVFRKFSHLAYCENLARSELGNCISIVSIAEIANPPAILYGWELLRSIH